MCFGLSKPFVLCDHGQLKECPSSPRFKQGLLSRLNVRMMPHRESTSLDPGSVKQRKSRTKERMQLVLAEASKDI